MKRITGANLGKVLAENINSRSTLMTDVLRFYRQSGTLLPRHEGIDHVIEEYVPGNAHTNTLEDYFSQLKQSTDGTHAHVSIHHLPRHLDELDFRYNTREIPDGERTKLAIRMAEGKRLRHREPDGE